jgi:hypothetical protein
MKPRAGLIVLILFVSFGACLNTKQSPSHTVNRFRSTDAFDSNKSDTSNEKVQVFLVIDSVQKSSEKGLEFSIKFNNTTENIVSIRNPVDHLFLTLMNESGKNLLLPYISRVRNQSLSKASLENNSFDIKVVMYNGKEENINILEPEKLTINSKENLEIFFSIGKILKTNAKAPYTIEQARKIPKGLYKLTISTAIADGIENTILSLTSGWIKYGNGKN